LRRRIAMRCVADRDYVARLYRRKFGRYPDLAVPAGFNEKILAKILGDRRPSLTLFADRLRVRDYVRSIAPELGLPEGTVAALQGSPVPPPAALATMISAAQKLSARVDFVRVDLYDIEGRAYSAS
jgi:hypothetical protein